MNHIAVKLRRGKLLHVVDEDVRLTMCGLNADGAAIRPDVPTCKRCLRRLADGA